MRLRDNSAFTLVELLITVGLLSLIIVVSSQFLIELVSNSVRIQNKVFLEQNYNFIASKVSKILQNADTVTILNSTKMTFTKEASSFSLELKDGSLYLQDLSKGSTDAKPLNDPAVVISQVNSEFIFESIGISGGNERIKLKAKLDIYPGTKLGATQTIERIITVRKSYKE